MSYSLLKVRSIDMYIQDGEGHLVGRAFRYRGRGWDIYNLKYRFVGNTPMKGGILDVYAGFAEKQNDPPYVPLPCLRCRFEGFDRQLYPF